MSDGSSEKKKGQEPPQNAPIPGHNLEVSVADLAKAAEAGAPSRVIVGLLERRAGVRGVAKLGKCLARVLEDDDILKYGIQVWMSSRSPTIKISLRNLLLLTPHLPKPPLHFVRFSVDRIRSKQHLEELKPYFGYLKGIRWDMNSFEFANSLRSLEPGDLEGVEEQDLAVVFGDSDAQGLGIFFKGGRTTCLQSLALRYSEVGGHVRYLVEGVRNGELPSLRVLNMSGCKLWVCGLESLGGVMREGGLPLLEELYLDRNRIGVKGVRELADGLETGAVPLKVLNLTNNEIGDEGCLVVAEKLLERGALKSLESFFVAENSVGADGCRALMEGFTPATVPSLTSLDLGNNEVGDEGGMAIARALERGAIPLLRKLVVSSVGITCRGVTVLSHALQHIPNLRFLNLAHNNLGPGGCEALARSLASVPALQMLLLHETNIGEGCRVLGDVLGSGCVPMLRTLYIQENLVGSEVFGDFVRSLGRTRHDHLLAFNFANNNLQCDGSIALADVILSGAFPNLGTLFLGRNAIGAEGCAALARSFACIPLEGLLLEHNNIGPEGAHALVAAFPELPLLRQIGLVANNIADEGALEIVDALVQNQLPALEFITMQNNNISGTVLRDINSSRASGPLRNRRKQIPIFFL